VSGTEIFKAAAMLSMAAFVLMLSHFC
jgi:hypothetical protein